MCLSPLEMTFQRGNESLARSRARPPGEDERTVEETRYARLRWLGSTISPWRNGSKVRWFNGSTVQRFNEVIADGNGCRTDAFDRRQARSDRLVSASARAA